MKITFFGNYLNHLLTSFCDELYIKCGKDFVFVSTEKLPPEMFESGYEDFSHYPYNLNSYESISNYNLALKLGLESDIVIIGSAPGIFIKERLKLNKHTFRYNERIFKKISSLLLNPRHLLFCIKTHTVNRKKNLYMLCASAYAPNDFRLLFAYPRKIFKWGYFTKVEELNIKKIIDEKPTACIEILWTARFINWKHPELAVKLAYQLKKRGYNFHLNMIGKGNLYEYIQKMIENLHLTEHVSLLGSMSNSKVRNYMQKSNIFIFTSDRNEGWGAVLNEAMSCGCAVVASNRIGAVPYLIKNNENGLIFKSECLSSLLAQTEPLFKNKILRDKLSENAYYTLINVWSPKMAASKFLYLIEVITNELPINISTGPGSIAKNTKKAFFTKRMETKIN